jgi:hypothetical protein
MYELFVRTLSQGLQAFMPVAVFLASARREGRSDLVAPARWAIVLAVPLTVVAGYLFRISTHQARWEALLAIAAVVVTCRLLSTLLSGARRMSADPNSGGYRLVRLAVAAAATLILVRQTMEIAVVLGVSAIEVRSLDATEVVCGAAMCAALLAFGWTRFARWLSSEALRAATITFGAVFLLQSLIYAFHESAEARALPWSDVLHATSEPYGPEGAYGRSLSYLLVLLPVAAAAAMGLRRRVVSLLRPTEPSPMSHWRRSRVRAGMFALACLGLIFVEGDAPRFAREPALASSPASDVAAIAAAPHLLFRHAGADANYNAMRIAPLDRPSAGAVGTLRCERLSFAVGRGLCLQAVRGVFTTYKAVLFDRTLTATSSMKLDGSPSRTKISADGRVGAITVFLIGHAYTNTSFSTKTSLIDMATGDELADLEQFVTWKGGARFKAADFNFWGVTFTRDSNVFYASLGTGGKIYLVKGDLGLRKLTVLREGVECPSLSPDNRLIVFKRRVASTAGAWRLYALDLATMVERPVAAETQYVDDQVEWLDNQHVLYAVERKNSAVSDVWMSAVDDSGPSRMYLSEASSPIVVR